MQSFEKAQKQLTIETVGESRPLLYGQIDRGIRTIIKTVRENPTTNSPQFGEKKSAGQAIPDQEVIQITDVASIDHATDQYHVLFNAIGGPLTDSSDGSTKIDVVILKNKKEVGLFPEVNLPSQATARLEITRFEDNEGNTTDVIYAGVFMKIGEKIISMDSDESIRKITRNFHFLPDLIMN